MNRKSLSLFLLVVLSTTVLLGLGWLIGLLLGGINGPAGAAIGGCFGCIIGAEIGFQKGLFEVKNWDRSLWILPLGAFTISGGFAAGNGLPELVVAFIAITGAGLGALAAKYIMRFFIVEPPPSIK